MRDLESLRIRSPDYWDVHSVDAEPARWDHGEWHHAVMGVSVGLPTVLRLDFDAGPAWFVAAIPQYPFMENVFIPGDEIMVVFSSARMRSMGYADPSFRTEAGADHEM